MDGIFVMDDRGEPQRCRSKKALREVLASDPRRVLVEFTSAFGDNAGDVIPAAELVDTIVRRYQLVGPDPYRSRVWYASLDVHPNGRMVLS